MLVLRDFGRSRLFEWHEIHRKNVRCKSPAILVEVCSSNGASFKEMMSGARDFGRSLLFGFLRCMFLETLAEEIYFDS